MKYLVDSNIIIYFLDGDECALSFFRENSTACAISFITYIEVLSISMSLDEELRVKSFLDQFPRLEVNSEVIDKAVLNRRNKKIKIADNIIVSTAQVNNMVLVTRNVKDFNSIQVNVKNIFE